MYRKYEFVIKKGRDTLFYIGDSMLADFHVHSEYSDDSLTPLEENILQAIDYGVEEICFTEHVDYGVKFDWDEVDEMPYRRNYPFANCDYPAYFEAIEEVKKKYKDQIKIRAGLEFGMQPHTIPRYEELYSTYQDDLDFILLSVHEIDDKEFWNQKCQEGKTQKEYNEYYYKTLYSIMQEYKHYNVLAHLDLITRYDQNGIYPFEKVEEFIRAILQLAIDDGKGIEVNTSSWRYGLKDPQPSRDILRLYKELGGTIITTGSDAHQAKNIAKDFDKTLKMLKEEIGFSQFTTFEAQKPIFHDL